MLQIWLLHASSKQTFHIILYGSANIIYGTVTIHSTTTHKQWIYLCTVAACVWIIQQIRYCISYYSLVPGVSIEQVTNRLCYIALFRYNHEVSQTRLLKWWDRINWLLFDWGCLTFWQIPPSNWLPWHDGLINRQYRGSHEILINQNVTAQVLKSSNEVNFAPKFATAKQHKQVSCILHLYPHFCEVKVGLVTLISL